jgi:alpha-glucosidase
VQDALLDVARFWLERGVDGFRLDTINFYFARQVPARQSCTAAELRNDSIAPSVNPYNHQLHLFSTRTSRKTLNSCAVSAPC